LLGEVQHPGHQRNTTRSGGLCLALEDDQFGVPDIVEDLRGKVGKLGDPVFHLNRIRREVFVHFDLGKGGIFLKAKGP
jgi:hypothetical protein